MQKILGITGIRSDYDLMSSLFKKLAQDQSIDFKLVVGGAHLSKSYGFTIDLIKDDQIPILLAIESLIDSDSSSSRLKTASIMLQNIIDSVSSWNPELIIYAGDREEVWIGALLGTYLSIPTIHFYGGDHTVSGHLDNQVRHAVSKLSSMHFAMIEEHKERLIKMGESPDRIRVIGNLSLDNFVQTKTLSFDKIAAELNLPGDFHNYCLIIFHPDPSEKAEAGKYFQDILHTIQKLGIKGIVSYPNTDPSNKDIIKVIENHATNSNFYFYKNLSRQKFISLYKKAQFIIGNSSSGILEASSIPIPAINVGLRQRGRMAGKNVIFCDANQKGIEDAINRASSDEFRASISNMINPYGDGKSALQAFELIKSKIYKKYLLKTEDPL